MLGGRLDALELGTIVRYPVGSEIKVVLPADQCWAYPETPRAITERVTTVGIPGSRDHWDRPGRVSTAAGCCRRAGR